MPETTPELEIDMPTKPARKFIAAAIPARGNGYFAQWAAPGLVPELVYDYSNANDRNPPPLIFDTEQDAEFAALRVMRDALNSRKRGGSGTKRDTKFEKMTGAELAVKIAEAGLDFTKAAELCGYTVDYLKELIDGVKAVPFIMHWAIPLLARHDNLAFAEDKASQNMRRTERFVQRVRSHGASPDNLIGRVNPRRRS